MRQRLGVQITQHHARIGIALAQLGYRLLRQAVAGRLLTTRTGADVQNLLHANTFPNRIEPGSKPSRK